MRVAEVMTPDPFTIEPEKSVREALKTMQAMDIRHVPVARGRTLVGIVSDRDLREFTLPALLRFEEPEVARDQLDTPIGSVMRTDTLAVQAEEELSEAVSVMLDHKVGALPVLLSAARALVEAGLAAEGHLLGLLGCRSRRRRGAR